MSKNIENTPEFSKMWTQIKSDLVDTVAVEGQSFFTDSFENEGFTDVAFVPWQERKHPVDYKILKITGNLKDSVQVFEKSDRRIVFGSDAEYAEIHNDGGVVTIPVTKESRGFFWAMYKTTGQEHWKYMAISNKTSFSFTMPQRQFIGESQTLLKQLDKELKKLIEHNFKK